MRNCLKDKMSEYGGNVSIYLIKQYYKTVLTFFFKFIEMALIAQLFIFKS